LWIAVKDLIAHFGLKKIDPQILPILILRVKPNSEVIFFIISELTMMFPIKQIGWSLILRPWPAFAERANTKRARIGTIDQH
jgi:hypothetical protein